MIFSSAVDVDMTVFLAVGALCIWGVGFLMGRSIGYTLGSLDGYGYARDPGCPGYKLAGRHIHKLAGAMWGDVPDPDSPYNHG
jgi:hypothetical protein